MAAGRGHRDGYRPGGVRRRGGRAEPGLRLSLWLSALATGAASFAILGLQVYGFRRLEATIIGFVAVIVLAFGLDLLKSNPSPGGVAHGLFVPQLTGGGSALLAVSIVGATVMPHVIYLHSSLTTKRIVGASPDARRRIFRFEIVDITIAMGIAGIINLAMLATAAAVFHARGLSAARLRGRETERFGVRPAVMLGQDLAGLAGLVRDGAAADLAAHDRKL